MDIYYDPIYTNGIDDRSRFPKERYQLIYNEIVNSNYNKYIDFILPEKAKITDILLAHDSDYVKKFFEDKLDIKEKRKIGLLPWNNNIFERTLKIMGGSIGALKSSINSSISANMAGGTHHAFFHYGAGYCIFNDIAVCSKIAIRDFSLKNIIIVDLDVHQGDGTASILKGYDNLFTFSMHCEKNYPLKKEKSNLDINLRKGTKNDEYLDILKKNLRSLEEIKSDIIFFQAGVDSLDSDNLGHLLLDHNGLKNRNEMVLEFAKKKGNPIVIFMGGGYSKPIKHTVKAFKDLFIQCALFRF